MSEDNSPETESESKSTSGVVKLALLAGVLGLGLGVGLYAISGLNGNSEVPNPLETANAGECVLDQRLRAKLDGAAIGDVGAFKALDRPYSVANIAFKDQAGKSRTIADWKGKTMLLNLWATWCAPCRAEMPALDELQATLGSDTFEVVPISVDLGEDAKPKGFFKDINIQSMGFFHDGKMASLTSLKKDGLAFGLPATLLINKSGCILGTLNGPAEWAGDDAKKLIRAAF